jgi:hypothetical protein
MRGPLNLFYWTGFFLVIEPSIIELENILQNHRMLNSEIEYIQSRSQIVGFEMDTDLHYWQHLSYLQLFRIRIGIRRIVPVDPDLFQNARVRIQEEQCGYQKGNKCMF